MPILSFARIYYFVFGLVTIAGGASAFLLKGSKASIIAGSIVGLLLIVGSLLLRRVGAAYTAGLAISTLLSLMLAGQFSAALFAGRLNPALYMVPLSVVGVCTAALLLFRPER